jgi:hypothetical protein
VVCAAGAAVMVVTHTLALCSAALLLCCSAALLCCCDVDSFVIKKEGKLTKKGAVVTNWKERWFVLSENQLTYAKKKGDNIIRSIPLAKVGDCRIDEKKRKDFLFHVITKERTFECKAKTQKEMEEWVDKIKECLAALRFSFYYGVIVQQAKSVSSPLWRVLELNFTMKCVRIMNQSRVVVQVPFDQYASAPQTQSRHCACAPVF